MPARYELLYILPTTLTDDEIGGIETKVSGLLTKFGGVIESTKRLGKFKLAYPIKRQRHGHYTLTFFTAEPLAIAKMDEALRITPEVVRHLILRAEEAGEQKFDLVQFAEVVVDTSRDERRRRERAEKEEGKDVKKPAEKPVGEAKPEAPPAVALKQELSQEELERKIESALSEDVK